MWGSAVKVLADEGDLSVPVLVGVGFKQIQFFIFHNYPTLTYQPTIKISFMSNAAYLSIKNVHLLKRLICNFVRSEIFTAEYRSLFRNVKNRSFTTLSWPSRLSYFQASEKNPCITIIYNRRQWIGNRILGSCDVYNFLYDWLVTSIKNTPMLIMETPAMGSGNITAMSSGILINIGNGLAPDAKPMP